MGARIQSLMSNHNWLKENLDYGKKLASSALKGADTARREVLHENEVVSEISRAAKESWQPTVIGAVVGALVAYLTDNRKSSRTIVAGGSSARRWDSAAASSGVPAPSPAPSPTAL